jgi:hypothetical protein
MNLESKIKLLGWGIFGILIAAGCSPSSYSSRYNKPSEEKKEEREDSARFTSENDPKPSGSPDQKKNEFNNPGIRYSDEFDEEPVEEIKIDRDEFVGKYSKLKSYNIGLTSREKLLFEIIGYLDTPYLYGGSDYLGIDCSAFSQNVFNNSLDITLPRTASEQFNFGDPVGSRNELNFGDLIFFNTTENRFPGHVGIYMGDNLFVHSSFSKGVIISSLNSAYYNNRYVGARRVKTFPGK